MKTRLCLTFSLLTGSLAGSLTAQPNALPKHPLNLIVFLVDDLGYGDISAQGNPYTATPTIDRFIFDSARGDFTVDWFNPRTGSELIRDNRVLHGGRMNMLQAPDAGDWLAVVRSR